MREIENDFTGRYVWKNSGAVCCYKKGYLHCEDGPAVVCSDGTRLYYMEGMQITDQEFIEYRLKTLLE